MNNIEKEHLVSPEGRERKVFVYDHISPHDPWVNELAQDLPNLCWLASLAMARQAHYRYENMYENFIKLRDDTINVAQGEMKKLIEDLGDKGVDNSDFYKQGIYGFLGEGASFSTEFKKKSPEAFLSLINHMANKYSWGINFEQIPLIAKGSNPQEVIDIIDAEIDRGRVPYVYLQIKFSNGEQAGHIGIIGGKTKKGYMFSDPMFKEPMEVSLPTARAMVDGYIEGEDGLERRLETWEGITSIGKGKARV